MKPDDDNWDYAPYFPWITLGVIVVVVVIVISWFF
jgi:hypothetical protein